MKSQCFKSAVAGLCERQRPPAQPQPQQIAEADSVGARSSVGAPVLHKPEVPQTLSRLRRSCETLCLSRWDVASLRDNSSFAPYFSTIWNSERTRSNWISPKLTNWQFYTVLLPLCSWKSPHWCREEVRACFGLSAIRFTSGTICLIILLCICFQGARFILPPKHSCDYMWYLSICKHGFHFSTSPTALAPLTGFTYQVWKSQIMLPLI